MNLEELDKVIKKKEITSAPTQRMLFENSQDEITRRRAEFTCIRQMEDRAIAKMECPDCGNPLTREVSKFSKNVFYYHCMNPDKSLGHVFIRS